MRFLIPFLLASPVSAWEFLPVPICTLTHMEPDVEVVLTFDQSIPEYTLTITRVDLWPDADVFAMTFIGTRGLTISTDRHTLSDDGKSLTVVDSGFGNVLNGLQFGETAVAFSRGLEVDIDLTDAAPAVAAFRDCPAPATS